MCSQGSPIAAASCGVFNLLFRLHSDEMENKNFPFRSSLAEIKKPALMPV